MEEDESDILSRIGILYNNVDKVKKNMKHPDVDINEPFEYSLAPLHLAAILRRGDIVKELLTVPTININLQSGSEVNNDRGYTPLQWAVLNGGEDIVNTLLANPNIDINAKCPDGYTALHLACMVKQENIVKALLAHPNIDVNAKSGQNGSGGTPLMDAFYGGNENIVNLLLADPRVIKEGDEYTITGRDKNNFLIFAVISGNENLVKLVLEKMNGDINSTNVHGNSPLMVAALNNHPNIVNLLLAIPNINVNHKNLIGFNVLHYAAMGQGSETINILLKIPELDPNQQASDGTTALHLAMTAGNIDGLKALLANTRVDPNIRDGNGNTVLLRVFSSDNIDIEMAKILLENPRVDPNVQELHGLGHTILHRIINYGYSNNALEIIRLILTNPNVDVNKLNNEGVVPFVRVFSGFTVSKIEKRRAYAGSVLSELSKHPSFEPDAVNYKGNTIAMIMMLKFKSKAVSMNAQNYRAVLKGYEYEINAFLELFTSYKINPLIKNNDGDTLETIANDFSASTQDKIRKMIQAYSKINK